MLQGFLDPIVISFITPNVSKVMCEASNFVIMKSAFFLMKSPFKSMGDLRDPIHGGT
jgi:hypothetical protein